MAGQAYVLERRAGHQVLWEVALFREIVYAYIWAGLTPLVLFLSRRFPIESGQWKLRSLLHLGMSFVVAVLHKACFLALTWWVGAPRGTSFTIDFILAPLWTYLDYGILLYWFLLLFHHALEYYSRFRERELRNSQLETQLTRAQLDALKSQLQPHFLFNTLNAISILISHEPEAARRMISKLADLLRLTLESGTEQEISLQKELLFLESYLEIEKTRFEDRLTINVEVPPDLLDAVVPNLILQPIVENAMRHGVAKQRGMATVTISAGRQNGTLRLQVADNGPGLVGTGSGREGIGLSNTRARIRQLYGDAASFEVANAPGGGAVATILIPYSRYRPGTETQ